MCLEMVTAVRMSLFSVCGSFKAWTLEIASSVALLGDAGLGKRWMKQHRLLFIFHPIRLLL